MPSAKQLTGDRGEKFVAKHMPCLKCKRHGTIKQLPTNFKCADLICDFCGQTSQVKTFTNDKVGLPTTVVGAAWQPQSDRIKHGVYQPLWLVRVNRKGRVMEIWLIPSEVQSPSLFSPRNPLSATAKRSGWQGYNIDVRGFAGRVIKMR